MANTITVIPGASIWSTLGNIAILVLFVVLILWAIKQIPYIGTVVPSYPATV